VALPVKELQYNRAPAVAPVGVLEQSDGWQRIHLDQTTVEKNKAVLLSVPSFAENIRTIFEGRTGFKKAVDPEAQLYEGFVQDRDRLRIETIRNASPRELVDLHPDFTDERLSPLLVHYKARSYPQSLNQDEVLSWEKWRAEYIARQLPVFTKSLQKLGTTITDESKQFVLQELQLWAESILPVDITDTESPD